jgi:hypothetical protein
MKIAPMSLRRESDGTERQVVLNPWNGDQAGFSPALGTRAFEGQNLPLEYLEDFQQKIRREIETRKTD